MIVVFVVIFSIFVFVFYGFVEKEVYGLIVYNCKVLFSYRKNKFYKMFYGFLFVFSISMFLVCMVMYIFVG